MITASGASQVEAVATLEQQLLVLVSGASHVGLQGSSALMQASVEGASECDAKAVNSRSAEILVSGALCVSFGLVDNLSYSVSGASKLSYLGKPFIASQTCTGASTVKAQ